MKFRAITVKVPGSTSNLGSGFDTLGLALRVYNRVTVSPLSSRGVEVTARLEGADPERATSLVREAVQLFFKVIHDRVHGLAVTLSGQVPIGRGLGASATARVGVLVALNQLTQARLSVQQLLDLATRLEGHPDNASPALVGGFTVSGPVPGSIRCLRFAVSPRLRFVTLIPGFEISTEQSRKQVPASFTKADAAHSLNRAALIAAAFAKGEYAQLRGLFDDRFHQPYRERLVPKLSEVIRAGEQAGAIGGWLSGSGSAIMCLALEAAEAVGCAMQAVLPGSRILVTSADNSGARCV